MEVWLYKVKRFLFHPVIFTAWLVDVVCVFSLWWYATMHFTASEQLLFLRYAVGVGVDFVGSSHLLFIFPGLATILLMGNLIVGYIFFERARHTAIVITGFSLLLTIYLGIALVLAVSLNV